MKIWNLLLFIFLTGNAVFLKGQDSLQLRIKLIEQLSKLRTLYVEQNQEALVNLAVQEYMSESPQLNEEKKLIMLRIGYLKEVGGFSDEDIIKTLQPIYNAHWTRIGFDSGIIQEVISNYALLELINEGVLKGTYPFPLDRNTEIYTELAFYKIKEGDCLAEIGAGNGIFSIILSLVYPHNKLYINEIDSFKTKYISRRVNKIHDLVDTENIVFVTGHSKATEIPPAIADKIIIRNAYHHFSKPAKMLASIRANLKSGGLLFLAEPTKESNENRISCRHIQSRKKILRTIEKNGFRLVEEKSMEEIVLMKFEMRDSKS